MGSNLAGEFGNKVTQLETCQNRIETRRPEIHPRIPGVAIETAIATEIVIATVIAREDRTMAVTIITTAVAAGDAVRRPNQSPWAFGKRY